MLGTCVCVWCIWNNAGSVTCTVGVCLHSGREQQFICCTYWSTCVVAYLKAMNTGKMTTSVREKCTVCEKVHGGGAKVMYWRLFPWHQLSGTPAVSLQGPAECFLCMMGRKISRQNRGAGRGLEWLVFLGQKTMRKPEAWYLFLMSESRTVGERQWIFSGTVMMTKVDW